MDKHITELNGKIFYLSIWAAIVILIVYLFFRYYKKKSQKKCDCCAKSLAGQKPYRDAVKGVPMDFCGSACFLKFKEGKCES